MVFIKCNPYKVAVNVKMKNYGKNILIDIDECYMFVVAFYHAGK